MRINDDYSMADEVSRETARHGKWHIILSKRKKILGGGGGGGLSWTGTNGITFKRHVLRKSTVCSVLSVVYAE